MSDAFWTTLGIGVTNYILGAVVGAIYVIAFYEFVLRRGEKP